MLNVRPQNQLATGGAWIYAQSVHFWAVLTPEQHLQAQIAVDVGLALGIGLVGLLIFRQLPSGKGLFLSWKRTYVTINGPYVAPVGFGLLAIASTLALPSWAQSQDLPLIPSLQTLVILAMAIPIVALINAAFKAKDGSLKQVTCGMAVVLTLVGAYLVEVQPPGPAASGWAAMVCAITMMLAAKAMVTRSFKDRGLRSQRGESRWATRGEVLRHKTARFQLPMHVSYVGKARIWHRSNAGAGRTCLGLPRDTVLRHILLLGNSGSAKGYGVFAPIIASCNTAFIYQDFKQDLPGIDLQRARKGIDPIVWGAALSGSNASMSWNPLEECRNAVDPMDEFGFLATVLVPSQADKADWVADLTRPILHYLLVKTSYKHLGELYDAVVERGVGAVLREADVPQGLVEALEGKNVKEYIGTTLFSVLSNFGTGWARKVTEQHDFAVDEILDRGGYVLSTENDPTRRLPLNLFWRFIIRRIFKSIKKRPCILLLDEALAVGRLSNITDILEAARSMDIGVVFGVQHSAGIKRVYQEAADSLMSGFSSRITLLNGLAPIDREDLHRRLGKRVVKERGHGNKMEPTLVDLMTPDDLDRRCNQFQRWWAVIEAVGATHAGNRILGILQGLPGLTAPRPEEQATETAINIEEFVATPDLARQAATMAANGAEVAAAMDAANSLEGLLKQGQALAPVAVAADKTLDVDDPGHDLAQPPPKQYEVEY